MERSFKEYIKEHFYDDIYECINAYIEDHPKDIEDKVHKIHRLGTLSLSDMEIISVWADAGNDLQLSVEIIIRAYICAEEGDYHYDGEDDIEQWYSLQATGDLACQLEDFNILSVGGYQRKKIRKNPLADNFVPDIKSMDLDKRAETFLHKYYPESLKKPMAIDPDELVKRMGLQKKILSITQDGSVFGRIYFRDSEIPLFNDNLQKFENCIVKSGTIFVDPKVFFLRNLGAMNNTIVHECIHWEFHRRAFELERLFDTDIVQIECKVVGGLRGHHWTKADTIEWQANTLAPRVQMPEKTFRQKAKELIVKYQRELGTKELIDVIEPVIRGLAQFFCVSSLAAKIRMAGIGYEEATGALIWVDGHYVEPHTWEKGYLGKNQTFTIDEDSLAWQCMTSYDLRDRKESGRFLYVDSHLVLDDDQYLYYSDDGNLKLTDYARHHMDECCIVFELTVKDGGQKNYHTECFLNRDKDSKIIFECQYRQGLENANEERQSEAYQEMLIEEMDIYNSLPNDYQKCMDIVKKWRGMSDSEIAEEIAMDERTVKRICAGTNGTAESLAGICLSLQLPPIISNDVIKKSPWDLNLRKPNNLYLHNALQHYYGHSIDYIREFLHKHDVAF